MPESYAGLLLNVFQDDLPYGDKSYKDESVQGFPIDLSFLIPQKVFGIWGFVKMLRGLFPKGPLWRFDIFEEQHIITPSGIVSAEACGLPTITMPS
jgi:hypothetical protein